MALRPKIRLFLPVAALAGVSLALAGASLASTVPWRLAAVATGFSMAVGTAAMSLRLRQAEEELIRRHLEAMFRREEGLFTSGLPWTSHEAIAGNRRWTSALKAIEESLSQAGRRWQDLEQSRASAEVRARRLREQLQQMGDVFESLAHPALAINRSGEVTLANAAARRLFGFELKDCKGGRLATLLRSERLAELVSDSLRRSTSQPRTEELELTDSQGAKRCHRAACRSLGEGGESGGAMLVLQDVTNEKAMQRRHAEFVSAASHEMKTPLSGIKAYVELLADGEAEDEATRDEFLGVIAAQAERLQRLIENLLNLARIEAGVVDVTKASRSLNEVLEEAFNLIQPAAEQKSITLQRELSPLYIGVFADRDMLLQLAINLLSNAVKYTPAGGRVTLRSRLSEGEAIFEVEDTGVGISPEDGAKVFEKFYRVKKDQAMAAGTGLGLPLAKHIVEDVHGGRLDLESTLGKGSIFRATLPVRTKSGE